MLPSKNVEVTCTHIRKNHFFAYRIASDEIGFIRLTEASALLLASKCRSLRSFGSVCDWMVTDLLQLLHTLSSKGGWKMVLLED